MLIDAGASSVAQTQISRDRTREKNFDPTPTASSFLTFSFSRIRIVVRVVPPPSSALLRQFLLSYLTLSTNDVLEA
jgi:hypothetical protein